MDEEQATIIWKLFEELAPNICYITRVRELLAGLVTEASGTGDLLDKLQRALPEERNASFRTDLEILKERLERRFKSQREG